MRLHGRIAIGPYGGTSKSARSHQAFLVTDDGQRVQLRRYDGPAMRDDVLEAMSGQAVVADGLLRGRVFLAKTLQPADPEQPAAAPGAPPPAVKDKAKRTS